VEREVVGEGGGGGGSGRGRAGERGGGREDGREGGREGGVTHTRGVLVSVRDPWTQEGVVDRICGIQVVPEGTSRDIDVLEHADEVAGGGGRGKGGGVVDKDGTCNREGDREGGRERGSEI